MNTYPLNKGKLDLPGSWDDLTYRQKMFAFRGVMDISGGLLHPITFRIRMLGYLTGYKPQLGIFTWLLHWILYIRKPFIFLYYLVRFGKIRYSVYGDTWKSNNRPVKRNREMVNTNLYLLSEKLDFAFTIQDEAIAWKRWFYSNPVPYIRIGSKIFIGRKFIMDIAPFTNITAKEYSDCFDLYVAYYSVNDPVQKDRCLDKLISILYPASDIYRENMVSNHIELIRTISPEIKFAVMFWFSGIVEFYSTHPIYSILFRKDAGSTDVISIGMNETVLMIEKKGYNPDCNLNDFFDKQIKILKDDLAEALAKGAKIEDLANKTGLSVANINRLVG